MIVINLLGHLKRLANDDDQLLISMLTNIVSVSYTLLPQRSLYVNLCGLIIGQRIRFSVARARRKKLYTLLGSDQFTPDDLLAVAAQQLIAAVGENSAQRIINLTELFVTHDDVNDQLLLNVDGVGPWTVKAAKLMTNYIDNDLLLHEDKVVSRLLKQCYPGLTIKQIRQRLERFAPHRGEISWYLWRSVALNK